MITKALFLCGKNWGNCSLFLLVPMETHPQIDIELFLWYTNFHLILSFPYWNQVWQNKNVHKKKKNFKCWLNAVANALLATCSERCLLFWITELLNGPVPFPMYSLLWTPWWRRNRMAVWSTDVRALAKGNLSLNWISSPRFIFLERSQLPTERWLYLSAVFTGCSSGDPSRRQR